MKECNRCHIVKPYSDYQIDRKSKDGYRYSCKSCISIESKKYSENNKDAIREKGKIYREKNKEIIKIKKAIYGKSEHAKSYKQKWYESNKKQIKEKRKDYFLALYNSPEYKQKVKEYRKANKNKLAATRKTYHILNRDKNLKRTKDWSKTELGRVSRQNSEYRRRAKLKLTDIDNEWLLQLKISTTHCEICQSEMVAMPNHPISKQLDHITPLNVNGTHTKDNVRYICKTCNLSRPKDGRDLIRKVI